MYTARVDRLQALVRDVFVVRMMESVGVRTPMGSLWLGLRVVLDIYLSMYVFVMHSG